jgi:hypothetical protein
MYSLPHVTSLTYLNFSETYGDSLKLFDHGHQLRHLELGVTQMASIRHLNLVLETLHDSGHLDVLVLHCAVPVDLWAKTLVNRFEIRVYDTAWFEGDLELDCGMLAYLHRKGCTLTVKSVLPITEAAGRWGVRVYNATNEQDVVDAMACLAVDAFCQGVTFEWPREPLQVVIDDGF